MRLTTEQKIELVELRKQGVSVEELAKKFKIYPSMVYYWTNPTYKTNSINRASDRWNKLTPEQKKEFYSHRDKKYICNYIKNRYHLDQEFRERFIQHIKNYQQRKKQGLF